MDRSKFIRRMQNLVDLSDDALAALEAVKMQTRSVERRRDILRLDEQPSFLYIVLSGWAARYSVRAGGSRRITSILLPGDFCGIHGACRSRMDHSLVALTDCEIGMIEMSEMRGLLDQHPILNDALWRAALTEQAILRKWLLASDDAVHALTHLICELFERSRAVGTLQGDQLTLPMTQEEMGDALGLTAIHINRTVRRLKELNMLSVDRKAVRILDPERMRLYASFDPEYLRSWA